MRHGDIHRNLFQRRRDAFTLIELLVVITIIGLIAGIALPAFKGIGRSNSTVSAQRQLLDDIALARQRAIGNRSDVYMVFVPPYIINPAFIDPLTLTPAEARVYTNLLGSQYTTYALVASRQLGDQPGVRSWRYLTDWRTLADGVFVSVKKFGLVPDANGVLPFGSASIPFPLASSAARPLPCVIFNYLGQITDASGNLALGDENIPLTRGSIFYARNASGQFIPAPADVQESPANNSITISNVVNIDFLTGRARIKQQELQ